MGFSKRKEKLKQKDFQKVKLRVGKGPLKPANATDTSFKAGAIIVREQNLRTVDGEMATSDRGRTLSELLVKLRHYNVKIRTDALDGILQILERHPAILKDQLGVVLERTASLIADLDRSVRSAGAHFYRLLLKSLPQVTSHPHISVPIMHTAAALSHIRDGVRLDALEFMDLWLEHCPDLLRDHADALIPCFLGMLSHKQTKLGPSAISLQSAGRGPLSSATAAAAGAGNTLLVDPSSRIGSTQARAGVLQRLHKLMTSILDAAYASAANDRTPTKALSLDWSNTTQWPSHSVQIFAQGRAVYGGDSNTRLHRPPVLFPSGVSSAHSTASSSASAPASSSSVFDAPQTDHLDVFTVDGVRDFLSQLFPLLVQCWLECNPASAVGADTVECMGSVVFLLSQLWHRLAALVDEEDRRQVILDASTAHQQRRRRRDDRLLRSRASDLERHFVPIFPFGGLALWSHQSSPKLVQTNLEFATVLLRLRPDLCRPIVDFMELLLTQHRSALVRHETSCIAALRVLTLLLAVTPSPRPTTKSTTTSDVDDHIEPNDDLAPLARHVADVRVTLIEGVLACHDACPSHSPTKPHLVQFLSDALLQQHRQDTGTGTTGSSPVAALLVRWVQSLPRLLWELDTQTPECSRLILAVLNRAGLCGMECNGVPLIDACQASLVPFFHTVVDQEDDYYGPFVRLPVSVQLDAVRLLFHFSSLSMPFWRALASCCVAHEREEEDDDDNTNDKGDDADGDAHMSDSPSSLVCLSSSVVSFLLELLMRRRWSPESHDNDNNNNSSNKDDNNDDDNAQDGVFLSLVMTVLTGYTRRSLATFRAETTASTSDNSSTLRLLVVSQFSRNEWQWRDTVIRDTLAMLARHGALVLDSVDEQAEQLCTSGALPEDAALALLLLHTHLASVPCTNTPTWLPPLTLSALAHSRAHSGLPSAPFLQRTALSLLATHPPLLHTSIAQLSDCLALGNQAHALLALLSHSDLRRAISCDSTLAASVQSVATTVVAAESLVGMHLCALVRSEVDMVLRGVVQ